MCHGRRNQPGQKSPEILCYFEVRCWNMTAFKGACHYHRRKFLSYHSYTLFYSNSYWSIESTCNFQCNILDYGLLCDREEFAFYWRYSRGDHRGVLSYTHNLFYQTPAIIYLITSPPNYWEFSYLLCRFVCAPHLSHHSGESSLEYTIIRKSSGIISNS